MCFDAPAVMWVTERDVYFWCTSRTKGTPRLSLVGPAIPQGFVRETSLSFLSLGSQEPQERKNIPHCSAVEQIFHPTDIISGFSLKQFLTTVGPIQCVTYRMWPSYQFNWRPPVKVTTIISSERVPNALGRFTAKAFPCNRVPPFQFYPTGMLWNKGLQQLASLGDVILCLYNHGPVDSERLRQQAKGKMLVLWLPGYSLHRERLDSKGKADRLCQAHLHCSLLSAFPPSVIRVSSAQTKPRRFTCYALTRPFIYIMFFSDITWPWVQRKDFYLDRIPLLTRAGANPKFKAHSGRWV